MKNIKGLPFYSNTKEGTHCFQACLKMILKYFVPEREFLWEELNKISEKKEGLWTWSMGAIIWFQENGFEAVNVEVFDYQKFIKKGKEYLAEMYGREAAGKTDIKADIEQGREQSKKFLEKIKIQKRIPEKEEIFDLMEDGYIIMVQVNSMILNKREGYAGHFVVVKGWDDENFIINDPGGFPGIEDRKVSFEVFEKAWGYPGERNKGIMGFRLKNGTKKIRI